MPHKLQNILARVPSDIDIAQAATPIPIDKIAAETGILPDELETVRKEQSQGSSLGSRSPEEYAQRKIHCGYRHHAHAARRRQDHHHRRPEPGHRSAPGQEGFHLHPPAQPGPDVRHQRRRGRRRIQPDHSDGGVQPPPHRRHSRHHGREQSAGRGDRYALVSRAVTKRRDAFRPALSARKGWQPAIFSGDAAASAKARHLKNQSQRPDARRARPICAAGYRCQQHHVAPRDRHERPHVAPDHHRPRAGGKRRDARHRIRYFRGQRNHGDFGARNQPGRYARAPWTHGHRHQQCRRSDYGGRHRGGRRADRADERHHHAQPDADARRHAGVRSRRAVRKYRAWQFVDCGRPDRAEASGAGWIRAHRIRIRRRHGHGEVFQHQVPLQRTRPELRGAGGHHSRAEDARRRAEGRCWPAAGSRRTPRKISSCSKRAART